MKVFETHPGQSSKCSQYVDPGRAQLGVLPGGAGTYEQGSAPYREEHIG